MTDRPHEFVALGQHHGLGGHLLVDGGTYGAAAGQRFGMHAAARLLDALWHADALPGAVPLPPPGAAHAAE